MKYQRKDEFLVLSDILQFLSDIKGKILIGALVFGLGGFFFTFKHPITFLIRGTFKESHSLYSGSSGNVFKSFLETMGVSQSENCGMGTMKSKRILTEVVRKVGMQATVHDEGLKEKLINRFLDVLDAERKRELRQPDPFIINDVNYEGEIGLRYFLFFTTQKSFEVRNSNHRVLLTGYVGERVNIESVAFTLQKVPKELRLRHSYLLTISPEEQFVESLISGIRINPYHQETSLLDVKFSHRDRKFGVVVLNAVMDAYSKHLKQENNELSQQQMTYLEKRKHEFCDQMEKYLATHVQYLKDNVGEKGFFNVSEQLKLISERREKYAEKILGVDLEEKRMLYSNPLFSSESQLSQNILSLQESIYLKKKRRDEIDLALMHSPKQDTNDNMHQKKQALFSSQLENVLFKEKTVQMHPYLVDSFFSNLFSDLASAVQKRDHALQNNFAQILSPSAHELKEVRKQIKGIQAILVRLEEKTCFDREDFIFPVQDLCGYCPDVANQEDLLEFVRHQERLLSLRENICKERLIHRTKKIQEFQGINLTTADQLYLEYVRARDDLQAKIKQLTFSQSHLDEPGFEFISLANVLPDVISQDMAKTVGKTLQAMRDNRNYSERDLERMNRKLKWLKQNLIRHISQTVELFHLQIGLLEQKMSSIQAVMLDLLNQDISLLHAQMSDRLHDHSINLSNERQVIENQMDELKKEMMKLPDNWLKEHQLQFSAEMNMNMLEAMARLVESKNIEYHLIPIRSKPLDLAYAALAPQPPHLKLYTLVGAFLGVLTTIAFFFSLHLFKGFPITLENLKSRGLTAFGNLSGLSDFSSFEAIKGCDIEILREMTFVLKKRQRIVSIITGKSKDYTPALAALLAKEGKSILLLEMDFKRRRKSGLVAYIKGESETPVIQKREGYDCLFAGGEAIFGAELLKHVRFLDFLEKKKKEYDIILLSSPTLAGTAESKVFSLFSDDMILTLHRESADDLSRYIVWKEAGLERLLGFVFC